MSSNKKQSLVQKVKFPWISIQNLHKNDENSYVKHRLIESVYQTTTCTSSYIEQPNELLRGFVKYFDYQKFFVVEEENVISSKKVSKKKKGMNKEVFRDSLHQLFQDSDFKSFSLENYQLKNLNFKYKVCHYLYIFYWCVEILRGLKMKKKIPSLTILDAVLSINRMMEKNDFENENYLNGFLFIQEKMNSIVSESFYELLFSNPKYLIHSSFQNLESEIRLYPEQLEMIHDILEKVKQDEPFFFANQHPTGGGKTFNCVPFTYKLSKAYSNHLTSSSCNDQSSSKCVLFACSNVLVRDQLAADFLNTDLHLWLAKHANIVDAKGVRKDKYLIRPYKSCFASNWKTKYKDDDDKKIGSLESQWQYYTNATQRIPNVIIADLKCCLALLKTEMNSLFIGYIDEFVTDTEDAKIMAQICTLLPKQSVLLSSVFPKFENIPYIVNNFCERFNTTLEKSFKRVSSSNIRIPVAIIDPEGYVKFPHHYITEVDQLELLIEYMSKDPRIRRSYPCSYVFYWSKSLKDFIPNDLEFSKHFPNIGSINQNDSCNYVILLLEHLKDNFHLLEEYKKYSPKKMNPVNPDHIFTKETYQFEVEGKTLCIFMNPLKDVHDLTNELFKNCDSIDNLLKEVENKKKDLQKQLTTLKKTSTKQDRNNFDKNYHQSNIEEIESDIDNIKITIPTKMILNHKDHFYRYHEANTTVPNTVSEKESIYLPNQYLANFTDREIYQIFSGIGVYDYDYQTKFQREIIMDLYNYFLFFCSGKQIIYGTNLANLCNIFLPSIIAKNLSIPELYQLLGRVGRPGSSNHANIITTDEKTLRILLSIDDTYEKETEVENEMKKIEII